MRARRRAGRCPARGRRPRLARPQPQPSRRLARREPSLGRASPRRALARVGRRDRHRAVLRRLLVWGRALLLLRTVLPLLVPVLLRVWLSLLLRVRISVPLRQLVLSAHGR